MALLNQTEQEYHDGNEFGNYQFVSLEQIINQFEIAYVGEEKIIPKAKTIDISFHAQRALQELSFDTLKSVKAQEILVPAALQMTLPQDYVNYTKVSWVDSAGIKHPIYPTSKTSNAPSNPLQNSEGEFKLQALGSLVDNTSEIVLVGEHKNIIVGMKVTGPYIPAGAIVTATKNALGNTTITIDNDNSTGTNFFPTQSADNINLTFTNLDGSLIRPVKSSHIVESLDWQLTTKKIVANSASDITNIKPGMLVSHIHYPIGTVVVNVSGINIIVSNAATTAVDANQGEVTFIELDEDTTAWANYKSHTPAENNNDDYQDDTYWPVQGNRYGLDPSHAQVNGSFYIDNSSGKIHFSSNISGKTVILDYISDSLGTDEEMLVHKFAEEAMYKHIAYAMLSTRLNIPETIVRRFKKEKFAETRKAKLRLSNIKPEEITQVLRGKSKQIKH